MRGRTTILPIHALFVLALLSGNAFSECGINTESRNMNHGEQASNEISLQWFVQNDNVMGGRSEGGFELDSGTVYFSGVTNTNGGGFSSIRSRALNLDLSDFLGIRLKVKADGRKYTWSIQTDAKWRGRTVSYWADFVPAVDEVGVLDIPFSAFSPQFRGYSLDGPPLDYGNITEFALYQYDKTDGPFKLQLLSVAPYRDNQ